MAWSISSGSGQASPARRARCRQSMTVVAPIDRLAAILRLDMPAAVSRSTSRTLRMGNLAPGIGPFPPVEKGPTSLGFADHPTAPFTLLPRNSQPLLGIVRNGCSGSVGTTARDQSVRVLGINWNSCSGSRGAPISGPNGRCVQSKVGQIHISLGGLGSRVVDGNLGHQEDAVAASVRQKYLT